MRALVVGGTKGFGKEISNNLLDRGYGVITIGRRGDADWKCDVSDLENWKEILKKISLVEPCLDVLACVVGYAEAKEQSQLTQKDWSKIFRINYGYVNLAFQLLKGNLLGSRDPRVITVGSKWSYRTDSKELITYIGAKHRLRHFSVEVSKKFPIIKINHYCVPTMGTPGYKDVLETYEKIGMGGVFRNLPKGNVKKVAKSLVELALQTEESGKTFEINFEGHVRQLEFLLQ